MRGKKQDSELKKDVVDELRWDTRVDETEVGVQVHNGVVTLTGTVASWAKRLAARDAAHRVHGVHDVADDLQVKIVGNFTTNDTEIAEAARTWLKWHSMLPADRIATTVSNGVVTLSGTVDCASQREDAARAVGHLDGVCAVNNQIEVQAPSVPAEKLRAAIEGALERHATREARRVQLYIDGGTVTVTADVDSLAERVAIVGAVMGTRGVEKVIDDTRVA
jgi:osmotically-inducible protein OsmY